MQRSSIRAGKRSVSGKPEGARQSDLHVSERVRGDAGARLGLRFRCQGRPDAVRERNRRSVLVADASGYRRRRFDGEGDGASPLLLLDTRCFEFYSILQRRRRRRQQQQLKSTQSVTAATAAYHLGSLGTAAAAAAVVDAAASCFYPTHDGFEFYTVDNAVTTAMAAVAAAKSYPFGFRVRGPGQRGADWKR
jgi:hypothetical protein